MIRRAAVSDRREFYSLEAKVFEMRYDDEDTTYYWTPILLHQYCLKAVIDGRIVGGLVSMPTNDRKWYLNSLFVAPEYRRMGIARQLMLRMLEDAWLHDMVLDVKTDRPHLVKFYRSFGFEVVDRSTNHYGDGEDRLHMEKRHDFDK